MYFNVYRISGTAGTDEWHMEQWGLTKSILPFHMVLDLQNLYSIFTGFGLHVKYTGDSEINPCRCMDVTSVDVDGRIRIQRSRYSRAVHNTYRGTQGVCLVLGCMSTRVSKDL